MTSTATGPPSWAASRTRRRTASPWSGENRSWGAVTRRSPPGSTGRCEGGAWTARWRAKGGSSGGGGCRSWRTSPGASPAAVGTIRRTPGRAASPPCDAPWTSRTTRCSAHTGSGALMDPVAMYDPCRTISPLNSGRVGSMIRYASHAILEQLCVGLICLRVRPCWLISFFSNFFLKLKNCF